MKTKQKTCPYEKKLPCNEDDGHYSCATCSRHIIEFAKLFAEGLEAIVMYHSGTYNVKYKGKKYEGTIEEIFAKWNKEQIKNRGIK